jgi:hypothetical protein
LPELAIGAPAELEWVESRHGGWLPQSSTQEVLGDCSFQGFFVVEFANQLAVAIMKAHVK